MCIWWNRKGFFKYELFPHDQTLNLELICQQLDCLKLAIDQKAPELANRKSVVFHRDNNRLETSIVISECVQCNSSETLGARIEEPKLET